MHIMIFMNICLESNKSQWVKARARSW